MRRQLCTAFLLLLVLAQTSAAQSLAADAHVALARWDVTTGEESDQGLGGRLTFKPVSWLGLDASLVWYPGGFPADTDVPVSGYRLEGLFGASVGPRLGAVRPFAKAAAGFLKVGAAPEPVACVAIYPPPIVCTLAAGRTLPAYEIGGGIEIDAASRMFIRGDVSTRFLKYPGPAIDSLFQLRDEDYFEQGLRLTIGAGLRF